MEPDDVSLRLAEPDRGKAIFQPIWIDRCKRIVYMA